MDDVTTTSLIYSRTICKNDNLSRIEFLKYSYTEILDVVEHRKLSSMKKDENILPAAVHEMLLISVVAGEFCRRVKGQKPDR